MDAFFASPSGSPFVAASAFILYLCLLVLYALCILLQLCLKVIRNEKKHVRLTVVDVIEYIIVHFCATYLHTFFFSRNFAKDMKKGKYLQKTGCLNSWNGFMWIRNVCTESLLGRRLTLKCITFLSWNTPSSRLFSLTLLISGPRPCWGFITNQVTWVWNFGHDFKWLLGDPNPTSVVKGLLNLSSAFKWLLVDHFDFFPVDAVTGVGLMFTGDVVYIQSVSN